MRQLNAAELITLSVLYEDAAIDVIDQMATSWVSENEGANSIEFDDLCEQVAEHIWTQVHEFQQANLMLTTTERTK